MLIEMLTAEETRVLGTLLEKQLATPDYYPMTLNALRNACNQKSSRDPITEYDEDTLSLALAGLKRKCLVAFIPYGSQGNQYKYRHFLEDARFNLHKPQLAVLAVLLLRGGQTLNEIRTRASSLHPMAGPAAGAADAGETEAVLESLAGRPEPLAEKLAKRPGWKEPRWRDRVREHASETESDMEATQPAPESRDGASSEARASVTAASKWEEFEDMKRELAALKAEFSALKEVVDKLRSELY